MRICQSGSNSYLEMLNPEIIVGTANTIQILSHSTGLATEYQWLKAHGRDWITVTFAEATTGIFRYTTEKDKPSGRFFTNLGGLLSEQAISTLELAISKNIAHYRHHVQFPAGITIMVGKMTSSENIQFYVWDTAGIVYFDVTANV